MELHPTQPALLVGDAHLYLQRVARGGKQSPTGLFGQFQLAERPAEQLVKVYLLVWRKVRSTLLFCCFLSS
jgi:hypothetical protein